MLGSGMTGGGGDVRGDRGATTMIDGRVLDGL
jgi:hypothetical protein